MSPRLRRLQADYDRVVSAFADHPHIKFIQAEGNPPEKYTFEFHVNGLTPATQTSGAPANVHRAEVFLPLDYPRRPPFCRMTTPVFHPNIDPQKICIGDHWSAGESLVQLMVRIAEMIAYQSYNVKSPLNGDAAAWAEKNTHLLPLDNADLATGV